MTIEEQLQRLARIGRASLAVNAATFVTVLFFVLR